MTSRELGARSTEEVSFGSGGDFCRGTFRQPGSVAEPALVIMGHGLGGTRKMGLEAFAERFADAGIASLSFTYRHFGDSGGTPRQLLSIRRQRQDWTSALAYARRELSVDTGRIALWGTSFGGGHALATAARDGSVAAVIAQCPFTDGLASAAALGSTGLVRLTGPAIRDLVAGGRRSRSPVTVPLAGPPGSTALMIAPDAAPGMLALVDPDESFVNEAAARIALRVPFYFPGRAARRIQAPVLYCVAERDSVAPARATLRHASRTPRATIVRYPAGHFDLYSGPTFDQVISDQVAFLREHLGQPS
jgi:pimeloyl-ACP methyl ester carboxylesterase